MKMEKDMTLLKERAGLSIGQKQLLAFARTMGEQSGNSDTWQTTSSIDTKPTAGAERDRKLIKGTYLFCNCS